MESKSFENIVLKPIGIIRTPFSERAGMPVQSVGGKGIRGQIILEESYREGLRDLSGFSHLILIYFLHQSQGFELSVVPFLDTEQRGLFATRAPRRPNPIGLSIVRLREIHDSVLEIEDLDMLDGTPLLDMKPFIPSVDCPKDEIRIGWLKNLEKSFDEKRSDNRF